MTEYERKEKKRYKQWIDNEDFDWKANTYLTIATKDHNYLVDEYNFLVEQYNALIEKCKEYESIVEEYMDLTCRLSNPINDECDYDGFEE